MAVLLVLAAAAPARAEMPARVTVAGEGDCPAAAALARALSRLHPALRVEVHEAGDVHVEVRDHGARYEVRVGESTRTLDDPGRRCGERATAAALAVTLLIAPPTAPPPDEPAGPLAPRESTATEAARAMPTAPADATATESAHATAMESARATVAAPTHAAATERAHATAAEAARETPTEAARATPTEPAAATSRQRAPSAAAAQSAPPAAAAGPTAPVAARAGSAPTTLARTATATRPWRPARIDLELIGLVDGAPTLGSAAAELSGGASLRLAIGGRHVAATIGLAGLAPATATSANIAVDVVRIPFDAGVRLALPSGRVEPALDAGVAFAVLQLSAPSLTAAATSTRLDVGARVAPSLRVALAPRWALVATLQMVVSFAPYDLAVDTASMKIGTTPRLWLGGGLGLAARL